MSANVLNLPDRVGDFPRQHSPFSVCLRAYAPLCIGAHLAFHRLASSSVRCSAACRTSPSVQDERSYSTARMSDPKLARFLLHSRTPHDVQTQTKTRAVGLSVLGPMRPCGATHSSREMR